MSLATFISQPCMIITRGAGTIDQYGDIVKAETQTNTLCELQPTGAPREVEGGNIGTTTWRLYLEGSVALNSDDAVQVDGTLYELVGDAEVRRNSRTGLPDYTAAIVRRVENVV